MGKKERNWFNGLYWPYSIFCVEEYEYQLRLAIKPNGKQKNNKMKNEKLPFTSSRTYALWCCFVNASSHKTLEEIPFCSLIAWTFNPKLYASYNQSIRFPMQNRTGPHFLFASFSIESSNMKIMDCESGRVIRGKRNMFATCFPCKNYIRLH